MPIDKFVSICRDVPEGSQLSPILFDIVAARELIRLFPDSYIILNGALQCNGAPAGGPALSRTIWVGSLFYVDELRRSLFH